MTQVGLAIRECDNSLMSVKDELAKSLPSGVAVDRFIRSVQNAVRANPKLATDCSRASLMESARTAAMLGLEVDSALGQGHIIPFRSKKGMQAQFIPGYKGLITLAMNAGIYISGDVIRENDEYSWVRGTNPSLHHVPKDGSAEERGAIKYAYAIARSQNFTDYKVLHHDDIIKVRDNSSGYKAHLRYGIPSTWVSDFEPMAIKTAIRYLGSRLPLNTNRALLNAIAIENAIEREEPSHINPDGEVIVESHQAQSPVTNDQPNLMKEINPGENNE